MGTPTVSRVVDAHEEPPLDQRDQPAVRGGRGRGCFHADVGDGVAKALLPGREQEQQDVPRRLAEEISAERAVAAAPLR